MAVVEAVRKVMHLQLVDHLAGVMVAQALMIQVRVRAQLIKVSLEKTAFLLLQAVAVVLVKLAGRMLLELVEMVFQQI
jgi:hypothetical protein